jgi:hypothetical protein
VTIDEARECFSRYIDASSVFFEAARSDLEVFSVLMGEDVRPSEMLGVIEQGEDVLDMLRGRLEEANEEALGLGG